MPQNLKNRDYLFLQNVELQRFCVLMNTELNLTFMDVSALLHRERRDVNKTLRTINIMMENRERYYTYCSTSGNIWSREYEVKRFYCLSWWKVPRRNELHDCKHELVEYPCHSKRSSEGSEENCRNVSLKPFI